MGADDSSQKTGSSGKSFVIISGLPRSGTSLMMQLLGAAGMRLVTDGLRVADVDNPQGYYEWERIKQIGNQPEMLDEIENGAAIKCISALLPRLPSRHHYRVLWMTRPIDQVLVSQSKMIRRLGTARTDLSESELSRALLSHTKEIRGWIETARHVECLEVDYPALVEQPDNTLMKVAHFLAPLPLADFSAMRKMVDPELYRNRT